jgi:hypothetical protein
MRKRTHHTQTPEASVPEPTPASLFIGAARSRGEHVASFVTDTATWVVTSTFLAIFSRQDGNDRVRRYPLRQIVSISTDHPRTQPNRYETTVAFPNDLVAFGARRDDPAGVAVVDALAAALVDRISRMDRP